MRPSAAAAAAPAAMEPKLPSLRKVHVVYYLSRCGQLEHPHLLEVSISSSEGLYLRDVKKRLAMIRGKRLPSTFAWSYKRSYKNGYVWQDLCDDDLIFPAHGCEYVLKGSEIMDACADKCRHATSYGAQDGKNQQELPKNRCQESVGSSKSTSSLKHTMLEKATEITDEEYIARRKPFSDPHSHITFEFSQLKNENAKHSPAQSSQTQDDSSSGGRYVETETSGEDEVRSARKLPSKPSLPVMVESGTDAGTQTEEEKGEATDLCTEGLRVDVVTKDANKVSELNKVEISSPPSSSSTTSPSPCTSSSTAEKPSSGDKNGCRTPGSWKRMQEEQADAPGTPKQTLARKLASSHDCSRGVMSEEPLVRAKTKQSSASSLLQFVSCGGLDIKEQILPMSLYLKSKGSQHPTTEHFCEVLYAGQSRSWNRQGNKGSPKPKTSYELAREVAAANLSSPVTEKLVSEAPVGSDNQDCATPRFLPSEAVLPDVISIGRSSISDRSTNVSRELDYQTDSQKLKSSGEMRGSPLFAPGKFVQRVPYGDANVGERFAPPTPPKNSRKEWSQEAARGATPTSSPLSEQAREHFIAQAKRGLNGEAPGYESMAQLWEELLAPKTDFKHRDERLQPLDTNALDWERTLQNAVDLSLPPLEFQAIQECLHCGKKLKSEFLKAHMKSCNAQKTSKSTMMGRPPKPDASVYQRILRASPPPT